ncbi:MAG TPA: hypothetical protein VLN49_17890 [Gemmatimonadaceae bacterium]|nr:hypothetical protein [Gemmatimonadaceae bacterium]
MRAALIALGFAAVSAARLLAQDSTAVACQAAPCVITFEWGNGGSMPPDPDRRYGAPSELEAAFLERLQELGFKVSRTGPAPTTLLVRISPHDRALCDMSVGTNPDYSCHTAERATVTIQQADAPPKSVRRVDVNPRCADPKMLPTFPQFGRYTAEYFGYVVFDRKGSRPASIKC